MELEWGDGCFVCGKGNLQGLRLEFSFDESSGVLETTWVPPETYQGYDGVLHGGILSTLLDEAVGKLTTVVGKPAVTAEMTVRFLKPVPTGSPLTVRGRLTEENRRVLRGTAEALLADGTLAASASLTLLRPPAKRGSRVAEGRE
ncbi:MAG: PaaI family thioesterase [Deltaproteobacteria bacterium]|nr:PaaI family thioesterase [Deltaproteobacteria bacterium]